MREYGKHNNELIDVEKAFSVSKIEFKPHKPFGLSSLHFRVDNLA